MTLTEFNLRKYAYERADQADWSKFRRVAYAALVGFNSDPKRLPKNERDFMPLPMVDQQRSGPSERQVEAFKEVMRNYKALKRVKDGR